MTGKVRVPPVRNGPIEEPGGFVPLLQVSVVARRFFVQKDVTLMRRSFRGHQKALIRPRMVPSWVVKDDCIKVLYRDAAVVRTTPDLTLPDGTVVYFKPLRSISFDPERAVKNW